MTYGAGDLIKGVSEPRNEKRLWTRPDSSQTVQSQMTVTSTLRIKRNKLLNVLQKWKANDKFNVAIMKAQI